MKINSFIDKKQSTGTFVLAIFFACAASGGSLGKEETLEITGVSEFEAPTNMPAVSVKGRSSAVQGRVLLARESDRISLEHLDAWLAVKSLATGMAVRDEHMRKHVFTTADGLTPDLHFEADKSVCSGRGSEFTCPVAGNLSIRGITRPFAMNLKVRQTGAQSIFKATGDAAVKLSDYEIPQPTQFGVKVSNEVKLRFEFTGKQSAAEITGGSR